MKNSIIFVILLAGIGKFLFPSHILADMSSHWVFLLFILCYLLHSGNFDKLMNRLTRIKIPGIEAQLAEMKTVRDETVASASEMKELKKDLKEAAFASAHQQALLIMQGNRLVGDDHITERVKSVCKLKTILDRHGVSGDKFKNMLKQDVSQYVADDLTRDLIEAVCITTKTGNFYIPPPDLQEKCMSFLLKTGADDLEYGLFLDFLRDNNINETDGIRKAFKRLDSFLKDGLFLDINGNVVVNFKNP